MNDVYQQTRVRSLSPHAGNRQIRRNEQHNLTKPRFRTGRKKADGGMDHWEWNTTQVPPMTRKIRNKRRNKAARASRKANR